MPGNISDQIFSTGGQDTRGSTRGPRGPKNGSAISAVFFWQHCIDAEYQKVVVWLAGCLIAPCTFSSLRTFQDAEEQRRKLCVEICFA